MDCYCAGHQQDRQPTYDAETNPNGRWRCFSAQEVAAREDLNFKWIDFTEEDDRSVDEILAEMQQESDGIAAARGKAEISLGRDGAVIDTQAIRKKILDLALRGKLTEQLPEDGTAKELYQRIQQEKPIPKRRKRI